ncbi:MAG: NAD-dependent epimerase/dehydratase family protein [Thermodesulfobacteriota bacterium]
MKCLVLGGKGFIGSHLVDGLLKKGFDVRIFDRPHLESLEPEPRTEGVEYMEGDFTSVSDMGEALAGCDVCYHLVSTTIPKSSNADPAFDVETNLTGTVRMLSLAVQTGIKKIIFISSGGTVYGIPQYLPLDEAHPTNPICSYGITKLAIEKYLALYQRLHGMPYIVLRLSNPFGERQRTLARQGAVAVFMGKILRGEPVEIWGDGSVVRDYVYIGDVVEAMILALEYGGAERIFNIGSGTGMRLLDVLEAVEQVTSIAAERVFKEARPFDVPSSVLAVERAGMELGWKPRTTFPEGLERMRNWLRMEKTAGDEGGCV